MVVRSNLLAQMLWDSFRVLMLVCWQAVAEGARRATRAKAWG